MVPPKRSHTFGQSTPFSPQATPYDPTYPSYLFLDEASIEEFMQIRKYIVLSEHVIDIEHLSGIEEPSLMQETKGWTYLNKLIKETNKTI